MNFNYKAIIMRFLLICLIVLSFSCTQSKKVIQEESFKNKAVEQIQNNVNQKVLENIIDAINFSLVNKLDMAIYEMLEALIRDNDDPILNVYLGIKLFEQSYLNTNYSYKPDLIKYYVFKGLKKGYEKFPPELLNKIGVMLGNMTEWEEARQIFSYLYEKDSTNKEVLINLANSFLRVDSIRAISICEKIIDKYPEEEWAYKVLIDYYFNQNDIDNTLKYFKRRAEVFSFLINPTSELILFCISQRLYNEAESILYKMLEKYPDNPTFLILLSQLYWEKNQKVESLTLFEKGIENFDEYNLYSKSSNKFNLIYDENVLIHEELLSKSNLLVEYFKKVIQDSSFFIRAYNFYIKILQNGDSISIPYLYLISRLTNNVIDGDNYYLAVINKMQELERSVIPLNSTSDFEKNAIDNYKETIKNLFINLAINGYYDLVAKEFSKFYKYYENDYSVNYTLGFVHSSLNDFSSAVNYLKVANKLYPQDTTIVLQLAYFLNNLKRYHEGIEILEQIYNDDTEDKNILSLLALLYNNAEMYEKSDAVYERALSLYPNDPLLLNNYAYSLAERGIELEKAMEMSKKSLQIDPLNSSYLDTLGWIYFQMKDYENARFYIELAVVQGSESAEVFEHMGDVYMKLNDKEKAKEFYLKAFEKEPDRKGLKEKIDGTK